MFPSGPFDAWLENKTRQRAEQRQREKLRAQIITSELLSVDYSESELAYERFVDMQICFELKISEQIKSEQELRTLFSICQHSLDFPPYTAYL